MTSARKAVAIIALILGVLGLGTSLFGLVMVALNPQIQAWNLEVQRKMGAPRSQVELLEKTAERVEAVARPFRPFGVLLVVVKIGFTLALALAAVQTLRARPGASATLVSVAWLAFPIEIVVSAFGLFVQSRTTAVTREMMAEMAGQQPQMRNVMEASMTAGAIIGWMIALGWLALKLGFFAWAIRTLRPGEEGAAA